MFVKLFITFTTHKMSIALYHHFDHMKLVRQAQSKQSWNIIQKHSGNYIICFETFLLSFVGHVIRYIFFNCQLNCSYIKGDILIIWFILGWGRRNNLMNHSFIELKRNLSTLNFSLFIYWTWLNSQYFWKWTNANPMKIFSRSATASKL